jgi:hypothetical protein
MAASGSEAVFCGTLSECPLIDSQADIAYTPVIPAYPKMILSFSQLMWFATVLWQGVDGRKAVPVNGPHAMYGTALSILA